MIHTNPQHPELIVAFRWRAVYKYYYFIIRGDAEAEYELGCCYETGSGTEKSPSQAFSWYKKAAQKGHVDAEFELAGCYLNGTGVKEDRAAAFNWCQKAAESGKTEAKFLLGLLYICLLYTSPSPRDS